MPVDFRFENSFMRLWLLLHQTYNSISKCEDNVYGNLGITVEQHAVLMAIHHIQGPVTPIEVGQWLDRNTNSISLIVERMVKLGLIKRIRDLRDRRSVRLVITNEGKDIFYRSTAAGWELIQRILSQLSEEDMYTLITLLKTVREEAVEYLKPGEAIREIRLDYTKNMAHFMKHMSKFRSEFQYVKGEQPSRVSQKHLDNGVRKSARRVKEADQGNNHKGQDRTQ